jgi:hypothetical protein
MLNSWRKFSQPVLKISAKLLERLFPGDSAKARTKSRKSSEDFDKLVKSYTGIEFVNVCKGESGEGAS